MKVVFTIFLATLTTLGLAQTKVSGKVIDEKGEAVIGANIVIKDSYDGISTGVDGSFTFTTTETGNHILVVSSIGYKTAEQEIDLQGKDVEIAINLKEEFNELEAVVISAGSFTAGEEKRRTILKAVDIATTAGATADIAGALNTLPEQPK